MSLRMNRLSEERKQWRGDHPFSFYAKSICENGGVMDLKSWECGIPGQGQDSLGGRAIQAVHFLSK
jgi:ubiquitin-conjugating enzyme E2 I